MSDDLTFRELINKSVSRSERWHPPTSDPWSGADWSNAMCGEAGEAANIVKKLRRIETGTTTGVLGEGDFLRMLLAGEIADTVAYAVLLAEHYGIDLADAVAQKFNVVSIREGFPERLPTVTRMCTGCGCTDDNACPGACSWVTTDRCSSCGPGEGGILHAANLEGDRLCGADDGVKTTMWATLRSVPDMACQPCVVEVETRARAALGTPS